MRKTLLLFILPLLFFTLNSYAQIPGNDACSGAIDLPVNATCTNTLITLDGNATDSGIADPGCAGYAGGDLWYKVTIPTSGSVSITTSTNNDGVTDGGMAVYTGADCNNLTLLACNDDSNTDSADNFELINLYGRTPGEVVYVRVWENGNDATGTFNICAVEIPQATNDTCADAEVLPVGATCTNTLVVLDGSPTDSGVDNPGCANYSGDDLWYQVTVPASGVVSIEASSNDNSISNVGMAIYSGADCNSLSLLSCAANIGGAFPKLEISRPASTVLYVRVWQNGNNEIGSFNLCATEITTGQPVNNACSGAIDLTVGATCSNTVVTMDGTATDSGIGSPGCAGYAGGDLWYKVTIPTSGAVSITTDTGDGGVTDGGMAVYTGADCNSLTLFACNDDSNTSSANDFEQINLYGRTSGEVVYVRVWNFNNAATGTINICAVEIPQATNDTCADAEVLSVGATCTNTLVVLDGSATDSGVEDPGCANYSGDDLWYQVTVPASGVVSIEASPSDNSISNVGMAVYSGADCNSLSLLSCAANIGGAFPKLEISQPASTVLYVRVWQNGNNEFGSFNLCATEITTGQPANNDLSGAIDLAVGATCSNTVVTMDGTATDSGIGSPGCAGYAGGDLWYKVTLPATGAVSITTDTGDGGITDGGLAVYIGADINSLTLYACNDDSNTSSANDFEKIDVYGGSQNDVIYVRVWNFNKAATGTINICAVEIPQLGTDSVSSHQFRIYPNPVSNVLNVNFSNASDKDKTISIYDLQGKLVLEKKTQLIKEEIDISKLSKGMYFVKTSSDQGASVKKFMVK